MSSKKIFEELFNNQLSDNQAKEFLIDLYNRGETAQDIANGAEVMRKHSIKLPISKELENKIIDNCGTGGDKTGSFNISTTVSFILASCGCYVAKHGNRSITSKSGSADMLDKLGFNLNLTIEQQAKLLEETGFTFMFAQNHHPAMKYIMPIRKSIPHRTIFNILGPLTNPANVKKQFIGVFDKSYIPKMIEALKILGSERAMVVSSKDGMDEISLSDISYYSFLKNGEITSGEIEPKDECFKRCTLLDLQGGEALENAEITFRILAGQIDGPKRDIVLLNAGYALFVDGIVETVEEGVEIAFESIKSWKAVDKLKQVIEISNKF